MRRSANAPVVLVLVLAGALAAGSTARAQEDTWEFHSLALLHRAVAADSALIGRTVRVRARLVADFFRDLYLGEAPPGVGEPSREAPGEARPGPGLRVRTGEQPAELGQVHVWQATLALADGELYLDAGGQTSPLADPAAALPDFSRLYGGGGAFRLDPAALRRDLRAGARFPAVADLLRDPSAWRGRLVGLRDLRVLGLRRDALDVPWLARLEAPGGEEIGVLLRDGQHPVLREGEDLAEVVGVWLADGEHWNLRPRAAADFRQIREGAERGDAPPARELRGGPRRLERLGGGETPLIARPREARPLLDEVCYDPSGPGEGEGAESCAVVNAGDRKLSLDGWSLTDNEGRWDFPHGATLAPGERLRVARNDERFYFEFGFMPDFSFDEQPTPGDSALVLDNGGDELLLLDERGRVADAVVFEGGWRFAQPGWEGPTAEPFRFTSYAPAEGQVLWRKRDLDSGIVLDTDRAADWIGDPDDPRLGRSLAFAGWDRERFLDPAACAAEAAIEVLVSPDNAFAGVRDFLRSAATSLEIELYLFTHPLLADELVAAMERGVRVGVLLDGEVFGARDGTYDTVRWIARRIVEHPSGLGRVWLWRNGDDPRHTGMDADMPDRYNHVHQKFAIADRRRVLIGSDNFTQSSLPADPRDDGTSGSRGFFLATDAPCVVERAVAVWEADCDPRRHRDVRLYVPRAGLQESEPRPSMRRGGYDAVAGQEPLRLRERARFELTQSPESALRPDAGYLGLVNRAGRGDWLLVQQQYERPWWGYAWTRMPNPRLLAYLEAARRGASVRVLLNGAGGPTRNGQSRIAADFMNAMAKAEGLDLAVVLGSLPDSRPGRDGAIHSKLLLAAIGAERWSHVGSANGSETAHRHNRELGLSVESRSVFGEIAKVFRADWERATGERIPRGPARASLALPQSWAPAADRRR